jgi:hypothetical protein
MQKENNEVEKKIKTLLTVDENALVSAWYPELRVEKLDFMQICYYYYYYYFIDRASQYISYSKTNVMQFLFSLLRIKGLYMFQALLTHP